MTFKAVDPDRRIDMTFGAKMLAAFDADRFCAVGGNRRRVTAKAAAQAVLLGPDAVVHGAVALMHQQAHVVAAHEVGVLDALVAGGHDFAGAKHGQCNEHREQDICARAPDNPYSIPIWMYPVGQTSAQM